jgi:hypothetical protein
LIPAGLLVLVLAAACSSGNAREAEREQQSRASQEAKLAGLQATYSSSVINPGTPTPAPTVIPLPTLDRLVLTRSLGGNGPSEELASVPSNFGTVYAGALLNGLRGGTMVSAIWRGERGNVYVSETTVDGDAAQAWVGMPLPLDGSLPPGNYAVILLVAVGDDPPVSLNSLVFEITSSGSQARAVSPGGAPRIVANDGDANDDSSGPGSGGGGFDEDVVDSSGPGGAPPIVPVEDDD